MNNHKKNHNKNKLFILREVDKNTIYAISEEEELITNYIKLFDGYFKDGIDKNKYQIDIIKERSEINKYLIMYQNYILYIRGENNKLTLTEWEWNYYKPFLKELYEKAKDTIVNLEVFRAIYCYELDTSNMGSMVKDMTNVSDHFYTIANGFDIFVGNIPLEFIKQELLMEPIKAHKFNKWLAEMNYSYKTTLSNK